jgi:hypothetical protein
LSADPAVTIFNLNHYCDYKQLLHLFTSLPVGAFPPSNRRLKGHVLLCPGGACALFEQIAQFVWNGKSILRTGGSPPNERGVVYNRILQYLDLFFADISRVPAPIDGSDAFLIDYLRDPFTFLIRDYIRQVGPNLYLGIMTLRPSPKIPVLFFMLEILPNQ